MKFQKTLNLTEQQILEFATKGKLHTGQWLKLPSGLKGQFIGMDSITGTLWICWNREGEDFEARNNRLCILADRFKCRRSMGQHLPGEKVA